MRKNSCGPARLLQAATVFVVAGILVGCTDPTRLVEVSPQVDARDAGATAYSEGAADVAAAAAIECTSASVRGRGYVATGSATTIDFSVAVGDTVRVSRRWPSGTDDAPTMLTPWRVDDAAIARLEGDLVIPLVPGRTRLSTRVAGRTLCVALTTVFTGAVVSGITVNRSLTLASDTSARVDATLQYSNGTSVRVHEAAQWRSLDTAVAQVSASAWITPRRDGSARIVASVGSFVDTASVLVGDRRFESIPARRADDFTGSIGVNIHLSYFDKVYGSGFRDIIVPRLQELGVRHFRDGGTVLPNEDWMREVYGRWRELADATGGKFTVIISPRRTSEAPGTNFGDMSHLRALSDRVGPDRIVAWEGINEHDLSGRPEFARELRESQRAMYVAVKNDPVMSVRHRVLGPSIAFVSAAAQVGDLSAFMDDGVIHPYDGGQLPGTNLRSHVDGIRVVSGADALQATEVGYHTAQTSANPWHWSISESAQAKYTLRQFLELFNAGVRRSFAYELIDEGTNSAEMEDFFGLLRNDGSRKPAFTALRNLMGLLNEPSTAAFNARTLRVRLSGDTAGVHRLVLEKADGRRYIVLWQNTNSFDKGSRADVSAPPRAVSLEFDASMTTASVYIPLNGAAAVATYRQVRALNISVPDHPVVIELSN